MEQYKLNLVKEAKKAITDITSSASSPRMDCTKNLRLLPKFDEKDQDTFFFYYVSASLMHRIGLMVNVPCCFNAFLQVKPKSNMQH